MLYHCTFALEDDSLTLYPTVAWEIVRGVFCFVRDRHSVNEPITVQHAAIILQGNHQKLANIFGGHVILIRLSCFEVVVEPFVQGQRVSFTIGTLIKRQFVKVTKMISSAIWQKKKKKK